MKESLLWVEGIPVTLQTVIGIFCIIQNYGAQALENRTGNPRSRTTWLQECRCAGVWTRCTYLDGYEVT